LFHHTVKKCFNILKQSGVAHASDRQIEQRSLRIQRITIPELLCTEFSVRSSQILVEFTVELFCFFTIIFIADYDISVSITESYTYPPTHQPCH